MGAGVMPGSTVPPSTIARRPVATVAAMSWPVRASGRPEGREYRSCFGPRRSWSLQERS